MIQFELINDQGHIVHVVLDDRLFDEERPRFHPLTNDATTFISSGDLNVFTNALGNEVQVLKFKELNHGHNCDKG